MQIEAMKKGTVAYVKELASQCLAAKSAADAGSAKLPKSV